MSYTLLIVESPAKCTKIETYLGPGYKCIASFGHIRELNGLESIDLKNNFKPTFTECESKINQITKIRSLITNAKEVLLASDDDREGEAIAWHICQVFGLPIKTTKRILFHEITETALKTAVNNPGTVNMHIVHAQIARQILDILVGYKLSPLLWKNIANNAKSGLSAGRCQTPALRIVYENQKEMDAAPGTKVYTTTGYFTSKNMSFVLNHNHTSEESMVEFLEKTVNHVHVYTCSEPRPTTKAAPTPFTTSALQQMASNELHVSPKETMQLCQSLYEAGYITYMRTDSMTYSADFIKQISGFITKEYGKDYVHEKIDTLSINTKEAHEAIHPTDLRVKALDKEFSVKEIKMYALIYRNTLESCMAAARYKSITARISSPDQEMAYTYPAEQVVFLGWKKVQGDDVKSDYTYLQTLKNECKIDYKKIMAKVTMKDLKGHYSEARLVNLLEQHGIGRPSTYSSLIDKIQERGYVKKMHVEGVAVECTDFELTGEEMVEIEIKRQFGNEKNKLVLQPVGASVLEFLLNHFEPLFSYTFTKKMEDSLDLIAKGEKVWIELCRECLTDIDKAQQDAKAQQEQGEEPSVGEIRIDADHVYMIGKHGPVIKCTINKKVSFKPVRLDIDLATLKKGEYTLNDLIIESKLTGRMLGLYNDHEVILKNGKFGLYIEWGELKKAIKLNKKEEDIDLNDIIPHLDTTIVRVITEDMSIRIGKFGDYIFYKKKTMKQPKFFKLTGFECNYKECPLPLLKKWIKENYYV